jgi:ElaB/YqjD/DUF883 family membrane-anchored ribosome-binding protein
MIAFRRKNGTDRRAGQAVSARLSALYNDFDALQQDIRGLMSDVGSAAGDHAQNAVGQVETWGARNVKSIRKSVRDQPFTACAIALSAGALVGGLFLRR